MTSTDISLNSSEEMTQCATQGPRGRFNGLRNRRFGQPAIVGYVSPCTRRPSTGSTPPCSPGGCSRFTCFAVLFQSVGAPSCLPLANQHSRAEGSPNSSAHAGCSTDITEQAPSKRLLYPSGSSRAAPGLGRPYRSTARPPKVPHTLCALLGWQSHHSNIQGFETRIDRRVGIAHTHP